MTTLERTSTAGVFNLRDLGGFATATGVTQWGRIYRGDGLHRTDDAVQRIATGLVE